MCVREIQREQVNGDAEAVRACREYHCMATWMRAPACVNVSHDCVSVCVPSAFASARIIHCSLLRSAKRVSELSIPSD